MNASLDVAELAVKNERSFAAAALSKFADVVVERSDAQRMIGRVIFYAYPEAEAARSGKKTTNIRKVHPKNGDVPSDRTEFAKGPNEKAEAVTAFVKMPETAPEVSARTPLLTA